MSHHVADLAIERTRNPEDLGVATGQSRQAVGTRSAERGFVRCGTGGSVEG